MNLAESFDIRANEWRASPLKDQVGQQSLVSLNQILLAFGEYDNIY